MGLESECYPSVKTKKVSLWLGTELFTFNSSTVSTQDIHSEVGGSINIACCFHTISFIEVTFSYLLAWIETTIYSIPCFLCKIWKHRYNNTSENVSKLLNSVKITHNCRSTSFQFTVYCDGLLKGSVLRFEKWLEIL